MTINGKKAPDDLVERFLKLSREKREKIARNEDVTEIEMNLFNLAYYFNFMM